MTVKVPGIGRLRGALQGLMSSEAEFRRNIWQRLNNPSGQTRPVFLVGCGRSGTSMLVSHLSRSKRTELYNEDNPAAFTAWRLREYSVIEGLINKSYAELIFFKPILDTYQTRALLTSFPGCKVIFAFRHFDDVINSSMKRFGRMNRLQHIKAWVEEDFNEFTAFPPPEVTREFILKRWNPAMSPETGAALYWLFQNRLYYDLGLLDDPAVRLVRYESVVADPVKEFQALCDFLGLEFEASIAEGVFDSSVGKENAPDVDPQIREDCESLWVDLSQRVG